MKSSALDLYQRFDLLKVSTNYGLYKSFMFYMFGSIGTMCMITAIFIIAFNSQNQQVIKDNEILTHSVAWTFENKLNNVHNSQYSISIIDVQHNDKLLIKNRLMKLIDLEDQANPITNAFGILQEDDNENIQVPSAFHQIVIDLHDAKQIKKRNLNDICVSTQIQTSEQKEFVPIQGLVECQNNKKDGFRFNLHKKMKMNVQQMQLQGVCSENQCAQACVESKGIFSDGECDANYYLQEICMVSNQDLNNRNVQIQTGCFDGYFEKLTLSKPESLIITIRDNQDPYLLMIKQSQDGNQSYFIPQAHHVKVARKIFTLGAVCIFISLAILILFNYLKSKEPVEIEMQELNPKNPTIQDVGIFREKQTIPLNY